MKWFVALITIVWLLALHSCSLFVPKIYTTECPYPTPFPDFGHLFFNAFGVDDEAVEDGVVVRLLHLPEDKRQFENMLELDFKASGIHELRLVYPTNKQSISHIVLTNQSELERSNQLMKGRITLDTLEKIQLCKEDVDYLHSLINSDSIWRLTSISECSAEPPYVQIRGKGGGSILADVRTNNKKTRFMFSSDPYYAELVYQRLASIVKNYERCGLL